MLEILPSGRVHLGFWMCTKYLHGDHLLVICSSLDEGECYFCYAVTIQVSPESSINGS